MKKIIFYLLTFIFHFPFFTYTSAQNHSPPWQWARCSFDTAGDRHGTEGEYVTIDNKGYVYECGGYESAFLIFGTDTLFNPGGDLSQVASFLVKYDSSGDVIWARTN